MHDVSNLVIDGTYLGSGWPELLPQQATALHTLVNTATEYGVDGTIDDLAESVGIGWFDHFSGGLDCDVRWTHPKYADDAEVVEDARRARLECIRSYSLSGIVLPATVRELARSMTDLGIFEVTADGRRWRTVEWPPLPEEKLAVSEEFRKTLATYRWVKLHERSARSIATFLPARHSFVSTVDDLARVLGLSGEEVRAGLELLVHDAALILTEVDDSAVNPETVVGEAVFFAYLKHDPFDVGEDAPGGLEYPDAYDNRPDFETQYELRFDEFDDPLTPRMAYLLWTAARWCIDEWHGAAHVPTLVPQLPVIARPFADEETWVQRFTLCFVHLESWLAGGSIEEVTRCLGEQIAFRIVVDLAEASVDDILTNDTRIHELPDHGLFDLDFDRARGMVDDHDATILFALAFAPDVGSRSLLHPARWFVPLAVEYDWEEE